MRIMGLRPYVFITSWYATAIAQFLLDALICALVIKAFCVHTPLWLLFSFIGVFCLGYISFAHHGRAGFTSGTRPGGRGKFCPSPSEPHAPPRPQLVPASPQPVFAASAG